MIWRPFSSHTVFKNVSSLSLRLRSRPGPRPLHCLLAFIHSPQIPLCTRHAFVRFYSQEASLKEKVIVDCRSNGSITLEVYKPQIAAELEILPQPTIIFLPSGFLGALIPSGSEADTASSLSQKAKATVVQINYRSGPSHPFPTPIHDVLTGYDWIIENIISSQPQYDRKMAKLAVHGSYFGGTLAVALALTECKLGGHRIGAAFVHEPILDWLFPAPEEAQADAELEEHTNRFEGDEVLRTSPLFPKPRGNRNKSKSKTSEPSFWTTNAQNSHASPHSLLALRVDLFPTVSTLFDTFASPIHFFRTPAAIIPYPLPNDISPSPPDPQIDLAAIQPTADIDLLSLSSLSDIPHDLDKIDFYLSDLSDIPYHPPDLDFASAYSTDLNHDHDNNLLALSNPLTSHPSAPTPEPSPLPIFKQLPTPTLSLPTASRLYARSYPPSSSAPLDFPHLLLQTTSSSPLHSQITEFTRLARRSVARDYVKQEGGGVVNVDVEDETARAEMLRKRGVEMGERRVGLEILGDASERDNVERTAGVAKWILKALER